MAGLNIRKGSKLKVPVLKAIREAQKQGKACPRIAEQPIRELLALPLEEARRRRTSTPPVQSGAAHSIWRENDVDPYDLLGTAKAA
jgi:ubiquinone biosynthesis protein COQ4